MFETLGQRLRAYAEKDGRGYPDWAIRYVPLVRRLGTRLPNAKRILEIGANENGLQRFTGVPVIAVDIELDHLKAARATQDVTPVVGSVTALPFRNDSFDICACVETLEHVPQTDREAAVNEIARVLGPAGTAVATFPSGAEASRAEAEISEAYRRYTRNTIRWLEEHAADDLPSPDRIARLFEAAIGSTHRVTITKNANLRLWRWMWRVMMCGWPGRGNALFQVLLRVITPLLCRCHFGTCYRSIIWVEPGDRK